VANFRLLHVASIVFLASVASCSSSRTVTHGKNSAAADVDNWLSLVRANRVDENNTQVSLAITTQLPQAYGNASHFQLERSNEESGEYTRLEAVGTRSWTINLTRDKDAPCVWWRALAFRDGVHLGTSAAIQSCLVEASHYQSIAPSADLNMGGGRRLNVALEGYIRAPTPMAGLRRAVVFIAHGRFSVCARVNAAGDIEYARTTVELAPGIQGHTCGVAGFHDTQSAEGLLYLADSLAAKGIIAVVTRSGALDVFDNLNEVSITHELKMRSALLQANMRYLTAPENATVPALRLLSEQAKLDDIGLLGYSRGGHAVAIATDELAQDSTLRVRSILTIAPYFELTPPQHIPATAGVIAAGCDGDTYLSSHLKLYDFAHRNGQDGSILLYLKDANHNGFIEGGQWFANDALAPLWERPCSATTNLTPPDVQRNITSAAVGDFFDMTLGQHKVAMRWDASYVDSAAILAQSGSPREHVIAVYFNQEGKLPLVMYNVFGGKNDFQGFDKVDTCFGSGCEPRFANSVPAMRMRLTQAQALATFKLNRWSCDHATYDASAHHFLSLRLAMLNAVTDLEARQLETTLVITDSHGHEARVNTSVLRGFLFAESNHDRAVLQSYRVSLADVAAQVNLKQLTSISLALTQREVLSHEAPTLVLLNDVEFD